MIITIVAIHNVATGDIVNRVGIPKVSAEGIEVNVRVGPTVVRIVVITIPRSVMTGGTTNIEINVDVMGHVRLIVVMTGRKVIIPNVGKMAASRTKSIMAVSPAGMMLATAVVPFSQPRMKNRIKGMIAVVGPTVGMEADNNILIISGICVVAPHLGAVYTPTIKAGRNVVKTIHGPVTGVNVPDKSIEGIATKPSINADGA